MAASDISFKHQIHHQGLTSRAALLMTMSEVKGSNLRQNQNSSSHCPLTLD
jgi:hypothetical protein